MHPTPAPTRRKLLLGAAGAGLLVRPPAWANNVAPGGSAANPPLLSKPIGRTGERLPVLGLGTWITFNVGQDRTGLNTSTEVVRAFLAAGGSLIDSSPMYGSSQSTIGLALQRLGQSKNAGRPPSAGGSVFAADKVWIDGRAAGAEQMQASRATWGVPRFDLMQVHNLVDWSAQLPQLLDMKAAGQLRFVGISTSHGRRHSEVEAIMREQPIDFVQLSYNLRDRAIEKRLLPLAQQRGIAVIVNRPFRTGELLDRLAGKPLPGWASDIACQHWSQVALKFVVSHPAVTCAIPATSQVAHLRENMVAGLGPMPDAALRVRIAADVAAL